MQTATCLCTDGIRRRKIRPNDPSGPCYRSADATCFCRTAGIACLLGGCAGYQIGNQSLYPMEIRTVYVPIFESVSFRRNLGERLTEAVMKEIELKTPYKVVSDPNADSILSGRIVEEGKQVLIGSRVGDPRELQVNIRVMVSWIDRQGRMLRETSAVPLPSELIDVQGTGNVVPEVGQSIAYRPATGHQPHGRADSFADGKTVVNWIVGQVQTSSLRC